MKYSKEQRLLIGREIYTHQISLNHAAEKYGINRYTARDYMREYRDTNNLEPMSDTSEEFKIIQDKRKANFSDLESLSKDKLINEVIKARVEAERAKKGYLVKGGGQEKVFLNLDEMNLK